MIFKQENPLKRAYEFLANPKAQFNKLTQPHRQNTAIDAATLPVVLAVGDTTYLDYKNIKAKRDGYGPIGNGGNGLILHTRSGSRARGGTIIGIIVAKTLAPGNQSKTTSFGDSCPEKSSPIYRMQN